ncbi:hypothetical protein [Nonomuraea sp. SBT364]|uniref:hypothetical protein n=1 Tax=Nonomuraea sp. SBT364 TaxID=1580530 RepID=UPI00066D23C2|nr:hypothetical protein [Nonomuraea sp. SBT364]
MASAYTGERRTHLETLAALLKAQGLVSRLVGGDEPVLWAWHPRTGRRTLVFATPSQQGWQFLWSPGGQCDAADPERAARALKEELDSAEPG